MITEQQQEQAALYALGILGEDEKASFTDELRQNEELRALLRSLEKTVQKSLLPTAVHNPPASLKEKVLLRIRAGMESASALKAQSAGLSMGLKFLTAKETSEWKALPVPGAF